MCTKLEERTVSKNRSSNDKLMKLVDKDFKIAMINTWSWI